MSLPPPEPAPLPLTWSHATPASTRSGPRGTESRAAGPPAGDVDGDDDIHVEEIDAPSGATAAGFAEFYRSSWDQVARGLAATIGDRSLAAEATDEAMARAYERWATVGGYDFPTGWVYRVGLNWARSYHRRIARSLPLRREEHAEIGTIDEPSVRAALLDLPVKLRSVVVCRVFLDWSVDETAAALKIAPGTVKSRLSRALNTLESTLGHLR